MLLHKLKSTFIGCHLSRFPRILDIQISVNNRVAALPDVAFRDLPTTAFSHPYLSLSYLNHNCHADSQIPQDEIPEFISHFPWHKIPATAPLLHLKLRRHPSTNSLFRQSCGRAIAVHMTTPDLQTLIPSPNKLLFTYWPTANPCFDTKMPSVVQSRNRRTHMAVSMRTHNITTTSVCARNIKFNLPQRYTPHRKRYHHSSLIFKWYKPHPSSSSPWFSIE